MDVCADHAPIQPYRCDECRRIDRRVRIAARRARIRAKEIAENRYIPWWQSKDEMTVYFISDGDHVKIGVSARPAQRLIDLQLGNPRELHLIATETGSVPRERELHAMFASAHVRGEWFKLSEEILKYLDARLD